MNINLQTWFSERQLDFCPKHFVKCQAPLTTEAKLWVYETLKGRFYISDVELWLESIVYFEDPQEATLYELTWS